MKRLLFTSLVWVAVTAPAAHAAGINLTWSTGTVGCWPEKQISLMTWACNNETDGPWTFVASFRMDAAKPDFRGISVFLDGGSASALLPDWWEFYNQGACRATSLTVSADFSAAMKTTCQDPYGDPTTTSIEWWTAFFPPPVPQNVPSPREFWLKATFLLPATKSLPASSEWYAFRATIDAAHTTATNPVCGGCFVPACMSLKELRVLGAANNDYVLTKPWSNDCICWQAFDPILCFATPALNHTWGQLKSLYR